MQKEINNIEELLAAAPQFIAGYHGIQQILTLIVISDKLKNTENV